MNLRRLVVLSLCVLSLAISAFAQGPGEGGAVLRTDFDAPIPRPAAGAASAAPKPNSQMPDYVRAMIAPDALPADPADPNARRGFGSDEGLDLNRDLALTPAAGNWLIMLQSYPGDKGPQMARKFCLELRNAYKVPAYVYVFGAEERRKERERVRKIVDDQQKFFRERGLSPESAPKVRHQFIEVHHAVLIGGFPDIDGAKSMLNRIKEWKQPDERKVDLDFMSTNRSGKVENKFVNPFQRAFVARNPTIKSDVPEHPKLDVAALRRLNADEPYSLFRCKKPYTLAIKDFQTPFMMLDSKTPTSVWDSLVGNKNSAHDGAKLSAHNLAEALNKQQLQTYVLHSKFSSTVTVGAYDGPNDPELLAMQEKLAVRLHQPPLSMVQFFYRPVPMAVPQ